MLGWIGTFVGAAAGTIAIIFTAPVSIPAAIFLGIAYIGGGAALGAGVGKIASFVMDTYKSQLANEDKKLAVELDNAKNDKDRLKIAEDALKHQENITNTLNEKFAKLETRNEELQKMMNGEIPLPDGKTREDVKNEYTGNQAQLNEIIRQLKSGQTVVETLTRVIQSGGKNESDWPLPTPKNIGWGIGLIFLAMFLISIMVKAVKKWMSSLF